MPIFAPLTRGKAATCQVISYFHVEKDLNKNEGLNVNLE